MAKFLPSRKVLHLAVYAFLFLSSFSLTTLFLRALKPGSHRNNSKNHTHPTTETELHRIESTSRLDLKPTKIPIKPIYRTKPGDDPISNCSFERPDPKKKVAVFAASTPDFLDFSDLTKKWQNSYAFYLPITVLAWKRIGFWSCVVITGKKEPWFDVDSPLSLVRDIVTAHGAVLIFLETTDELKSGLAQIARLFVADMEPFSKQPDTYLITSDVDILPISQFIYELPPTADIHVTDAWCCYVIAHKGRAYRMFPMATIGMRVSTWRTVMQYSTSTTKENAVDRIWDTVRNEFGSIPYNMSRGVNGKWFFDQRLISYKIGEWRSVAPANRTCRLSLRKARESSNEFRWIRAEWPQRDATREVLLSANDAHGPPDAPITRKGFEQFLPLATVLTEKFNFDFSDYWTTFTKKMLKGKNETLLD